MVLASGPLVVGLVIISLGYGFLNGYNDAGAIIVGMIAGRALLPRQALVLAAVAELVGPFLFGVGVAATVASGIVDPNAVDARVILAAVLGLATLGHWGVRAGHAQQPVSWTGGGDGGRGS